MTGADRWVLKRQASVVIAPIYGAVGLTKPRMDSRVVGCTVVCNFITSSDLHCHAFVANFPVAYVHEIVDAL